MKNFDLWATIWIVSICLVAQVLSSTRCDSLRSSKNNRVNCTASGEVRCLDGWTGDACNKAICREECHSVHGYCTQPGECKCALGWRGKNCDECVPLPGCKHGFCSKTSYECICEAGWEGSYCSIPVCGGGCNSARGYCKLPGECRCRIGWSGDTCESCKSLPGCANGYCTKPLECRCKTGWTGIHCDKPICKPNCSKVNGYCKRPGECRCEVGWWGDNCDTCYPYPGCKHGTCERPWECKCKPGWTGMLCNKQAPEGLTHCEKYPNACLNGGTCVDVPDELITFKCSCPAFFTGKRCDYLRHSRASFFPIITRGSSRLTFSNVLPLTTVPPLTTVLPPSTVITKSFTTTTEAATTTTSVPTTTEEVTTTTESTTTTTSPPTTTEPPSTTIEDFSTTFPPKSFDEISVSVSTSVSMSTSAAITEPPIREEPELRTPQKMAIKVTKLGPIESPEISTEFETATTEQNPITEITTQRFKLNPKIIELDHRRRKYISSLGKPATTKAPRVRTPGKKKGKTEEDLVIPTAEELYSEISKIDKSESPSVLILQLSEQNGDFETQPFRSTDANSPSANQITSRFENSPIHRIHPASVPILVTQDDLPPPSSLSSSPYLVAAGFDSLSQASSVYPYEDFIDLPPQTRINRRTGKAPQYLSLPIVKKEVEVPPPKKKLSYYEEHHAGRVHIGDVTELDDHAPLEEIVNAFIELKKLRS